MSTTRRLHFQIAILQRDGDAILNATEEHLQELGERLQEGFLAPTQALLEQVGKDIAAQKSKRADVGNLTKAQDLAFENLKKWISKARDVAKLAFPGQDVKLREEFQVGVNKPSDLPSVMGRAKIILESLGKTENAAAFKGRGWIAADTAAFQAVRDSLVTADQSQENTKGDALAATTARDHTALELYDRLLTIQAAADLQWPADNPANIAIRTAFRLGTFPPPADTGPDKSEPAPTPTPKPTDPAAGK